MTRIQLEISEDRNHELEALMKEVGISTKKELFNNALTALEWMIKEKKAGRSIASIDENHQTWKEMVMPVFSHLG